MSEKTYFNLHITGIGYLNRIRDVTPKQGESFLACDIAALNGPSDKKALYVRFDTRVSGTDAQHLVNRCRKAVNDDEQKVPIGFKLGDLWTEIFTHTKGKKAGKQDVSLKARLLFIRWIKIDGELVYKAEKPEAEATELCGDTFSDVRVPHKGNISGEVIEGAYTILRGFEEVGNSREAMRAISLDEGEQQVFARSALTLKYDDPKKPLPIAEEQILRPRRGNDQGSDLWSVFNRVQENLVKGGLSSRSAQGRQQRTRPVQGIDQNIRLNRALWLLADGMRQLKN